MTLLVDTNILLDVLENDPQWAEWSIFQLRTQSTIHQLAINPIIYAELSLAFLTVEKLDDTIMSLDLHVLEIPRAALFLAGKAFLQFRRRGGTKMNVPADFFIGAHAAVAGYPLLTRDQGRYRDYFPTLTVIMPDKSPEII